MKNSLTILFCLLSLFTTAQKKTCRQKYKCKYVKAQYSPHLHG